MADTVGHSGDARVAWRVLVAFGALALSQSTMPVGDARAQLPTASPVRIGGRIEGYGIARFDDASPRQLPQARIDLHAEQSIGSRLRWRIATIGLWGGPPEDAHAGVFDLGHSFQNLSPSLEFEEAYVDYRGEAFDLRVGKQKFFWGRLDSVQPNDLLNPRQYEDPFLMDERELKIGVPAIAFTWLLPRAWRETLPDESRFTIAWEPIAVPWRFPLAEERWFAPAARVTPRLSVGELEGTPCPCDVAVEQTLRNAPPPARQFDNGNLGARFSARLGETDVALVYYDGFDPAPNFSVPVRVAVGEAEPGAVVPVTAFTQLVPAYRRFRSLGADAATPVGPLTVRAEAAWRFRRPYPSAVQEITNQILGDPALVDHLVRGETVEVPAFAERDAVEWGIGADTVLDGFVPLVELYQLILLHNDRRLLVRDVDTRLAANLRKRWMSDRLEGQLIALWGIESGYELLRGQLAYEVREGVQVVAGVLGIFGDRNSLIGQYDRNSEAYARIRYTF
ncbi:MAG TPA: DUF1302 family protein [Burkholderiales bacterium]|nr:DUF1302 family protein [Burkholderiales bacterium]